MLLLFIYGHLVDVLEYTQELSRSLLPHRFSCTNEFLSLLFISPFEPPARSTPQLEVEYVFTPGGSRPWRSLTIPAASSGTGESRGTFVTLFIRSTTDIFAKHLKHSGGSGDPLAPCAGTLNSLAMPPLTLFFQIEPILPFSRRRHPLFFFFLSSGHQLAITIVLPYIVPTAMKMYIAISVPLGFGLVGSYALFQPPQTRRHGAEILRSLLAFITLL